MVTRVETHHIPYSQMTQEQQAQRRHDATQAAAGVGAAGVTSQVGFSKYAASRGKSSMGMLQKMYNDMIKTTKTVSENKKVATGLWARFSHDAKKFSVDAMGRLMKLKDNKILGPIIKSPVMKKLTGLFGGVMAFFVLITGLSETAKNGKIALSDVREKFNIAA